MRVPRPGIFRPGLTQLIAVFLASALTLLAGCGFHLREPGSTALPEALSRLRVLIPDSKLSNDALLVTMKNALQANANASVTDELTVPTLFLFAERSSTQVLSVGAKGQATGYLLRYELSYRLTDVGGKELLAPQTIRLVNEYSFDPLNVLAKEQEEQELKRRQQREAVQQILRRLSRLAVPSASKSVTPPSSEK